MKLNAADSLHWTSESVSAEELWDITHENAKIIAESVPVTKTMMHRSGAIKSRSVWDRTLLIKQ